MDYRDEASPTLLPERMRKTRRKPSRSAGLLCHNPWRPQRPASAGPKEPSLEQLTAALDGFLDRVPADHVTLSGGEPLLCPHVNALTQRVKRHCGSIAITTNGRGPTCAGPPPWSGPA